MNKTIITIWSILALIIAVPYIEKPIAEGIPVEPLQKIDRLSELSTPPQAELALKEVNTPPKAQTPSTSPVSGSCMDWIRQAGIQEVDVALKLIHNESGCNPSVINRSSGACGVAQELPCGKSGCSLGDGACQVKWMDRYVKSRYGTWSNALATWQSRSPHWY